MMLGTRRAPDVRVRLRAFIGVAVLVMLLIGLGTAVVARIVAQNEALREAERTTSRLGDLVVGPLLGDVLAGNADRREELDRAIAIRLADGTMAEINVWRADGTVVYANEGDVIGKRFEPSPAVLAAIEQGRTTAEIDTADETGDLPPGERFVEVYTPLSVPGQPPLAFEAYYSSRRVDDRAATLAAQLILLAVVPLALLQVVQIPIAVSLARRVARQEAERAALLERVLSASDRERRTIATNLHDGVVQDLAGVGYALGALAGTVPPGLSGIADTCSSSVRRAVETLRRLMIDIYPPDLSGAGLAAAIGDLAQPLRDLDVEVTVEVAPLPAMAPDTAAAIYRVARETIANVVKHARASAVRIELGPDADAPAAGPDAVRLSVVDNGVGLAPDAMERREDGHLGVHMLADRVIDLGGRFTLTSAGSGGTEAVAVLPARPAP